MPVTLTLPTLTTPDDLADIHEELSRLRQHVTHLAGVAENTAPAGQVADITGRLDALTGRLDALAAQVAALAEQPPTPPTPPTPGPAPEHPGHQPGLTYLGYSTPLVDFDTERARVGEPTVHRIFTGNTRDGSKEVDWITRSHQAGRLPWTSWSGDPTVGELEARFAWYQTLDAPALVTWHHEPVGDMTPAEYVAGWEALLDRADRMGGLGQVTLAPIMNGYPFGAWQTWTDEQIAEWLPDRLLERLPLTGFDVYHGGTVANQKEPPAPKLERMLAWADRHPVRQLGLGETGCFNAADWVDEWAVITDSGRFSAVCYFNSGLNTREGVPTWQLDGDLLSVFQASLASDRVARLTARH